MSLGLWLVRHGESTWNAMERVQGWADPPLSDRGQWQAQQVAHRLVGVPLAAIYCSNLQRALQTAQIVADLVGLTPVSDPRLREHGMGEATGMPWGRDAFISRWPFLTELVNQGKPIREYIPGAESQEAFSNRINAAINEIRQAYAEGDIAVVAHGGVFRAYLADVLHMSMVSAEFSFGNASLTHIEFTEMNFAKVRFVNDCTHVLNQEV
ncbi:MAG: histidine phosphatase family protein [Anaerolineae bacterium]|nr:histidine phosphatase family protein [Anaerolineae bacterium]